jgi:hypothetical protein
MIPAAALLLVALAAAEPAAAEPTPADPPEKVPGTFSGAERLELASGETVEGRLTEVRDGALVFRTGAGERLFKLAELARLERWPAAAARRETDGLVTAAGDVLELQVLDLDKGRFHLDSPRFGELTLEAGGCRLLFFDRGLAEAAERARAAGGDELELATGSRTPAELRWVQADKLGFQSPLGALDVKKKDLAWVRLAGRPPEKPEAGRCRLRLSSGEALVGRPLALAGGRLRLAWLGRELEVPWDLVRAIESPGERLAYLSELEPSAQKTAAALGPVRPMAADRSAAGAPLVLGGRSFERGLGMRARTEAAWRLEGKWKRFRALAGLDAEAAARGSRGAVFKVLADGRKLFEKQLLADGAPAAVDLDVSGVKELVLALEPGPGFEVGDYGDWADARLLR